MQIPVLKLPRAVPPERLRQPQANIPQTRAERERVQAARHCLRRSSANPCPHCRWKNCGGMRMSSSD